MECRGDGVVACARCYGFGDATAAREWETQTAAQFVPEGVLRSLLTLVPKLDAAGLPRFELRELSDGHARPTVTIEIRAENAASIHDLCVMGFARSEAQTEKARRHMVRLTWIGSPTVVRTKVRPVSEAVTP
ncbi:MAG: hypothetical protein R3A48_29125 [Polyangiales bacterium]